VQLVGQYPIIRLLHGTKTKMIVKGFKKCCISYAKNRTDAGMSWNGTKKDGKVRS